MAPLLDQLRRDTEPSVLEIVERVWSRKNDFVRWPKKALVFMPGVSRVRYHKYNQEQKQLLHGARIRVDSRSNGPAIMAYLLAEGDRPLRTKPGKAWSVHHIYDGCFPAPGRETSRHAVKYGDHFTASAGLVAVHPIADSLADEVPYFAWLLRCEAFERFGFDPDGVFTITTS